MFRRSRLAATLVVLAAGAMGMWAAASAAGTSHAPAPGRRLVNRFFSETKRHDTTGLRRFLSPAFQLQRADGSRLTKTQFLHNLPIIISYKLRALRTTSTHGVLVVTYQAAAEEVINGKKYKTGYAPRISTFIAAAHGWQLVEHANFNTPKK